MKRDRFVVDTNVPLIANGKGSTTPACVIACTQQLQRLMSQGHLVIDDAWHILREYQKKLRPSGQPGLGDAFLKWTLTYQSNPDRCTRVPITPLDGDSQLFKEFPADPGLSGFDPSDRKFVAAAAAAPGRVPILQGFDSKWWGFREALGACGVEVRFLCEEEIATKYEKKALRRL